MPANWKVCMEAFLEAYHEVATHPQIMECFADANSQYDVWERSSRLFTLFGVSSPHLGEVDEEEIFDAAMEFVPDVEIDGLSRRLPEGANARAALAEYTRGLMKGMLGLDWSGKSVAEVVDAAQYLVFPNWCPWSGLANALQYRFRPNGNDPDSCIFDIRMMYPVPPGGPRPPKAPLHELDPDETWANAPELAGFSLLMDQDESNLVAIQKGLRATKRTGVNFGRYQESRIRHFHQLLEEYLGY